ncbi:putative ESSS subunit of NADH:ubiquinone oxidoreductase (complex I) [Lyophyllum shimeji]|uniref:NADH dehydrogenase [ubiquinone] 1 beta subcomplex subunit 11, mitochondrial n=1 Tax=Lyophyllum shimeji TaxID=47721 RepID=A0A9P3PI55_LYOSH|nr:putative ESSS subunit of NADH:ubiquinone oxidoreductase (complex I) [Lyophyllum shimeji]
MLSSTTLRTLRIAAPRFRGRRFASHEAPQYNEPSGYLFGEKPPPPGQKRVKQDWENIWYIGMYGTMVFAGIMLYYKPDTSIQTWALNEAKRRMEERGEKYKYEPSGSPPPLSS